MTSAARQGDPVLATDVHVVAVPSGVGPVPTPLPHAFSGTLQSGTSTDVLIDNRRAATVGSVADNQPPHLPTPPGTSFMRPPANRGVVNAGSIGVFINGQQAARVGDPVRTCNDPVDVPVGSVTAGSTTVLIG